MQNVRNTHQDAEKATPLSFAINTRDRNTLTMVEHAVRSRNVMLAYQPVVNARRQRKAAFFEGLVRVMDPTGRTIPAREFITQIETHEIGRIIDCLALELGLAALETDPKLRLSLNLSARSIGYKRWMRTFEEGMSRTPGLRGRLILEITEASAMVMPDIVQAFMADLQSTGVLFALDDFGAGHTSFRYLKNFCFDIIKIDGQFVRDVDTDPDNQVLLQALVDIARHFDMFTVAETVESAQEAAFLTAIGVDCLQGYHFGAPALKPQRKIRPMARKAG
ncbi:MAG: EAL domain-containing protein [Pseudomonadota bacterium]